MTPENVLNAIYDRLRPLVLELARYNTPLETIRMEFDAGNVTFEFKDNSDEIAN